MCRSAPDGRLNGKARERAAEAGSVRYPTETAFPALAEFARGYLHEDLVPEYGDAAGAVRAFCRDASPGERAALAADLARLVAARG